MSPDADGSGRPARKGSYDFGRAARTLLYLGGTLGLIVSAPLAVHIGGGVLYGLALLARYRTNRGGLDTGTPSLAGWLSGAALLGRTESYNLLLGWSLIAGEIALSLLVGIYRWANEENRA